MKEFLLVFEPADDYYCTENTVVVQAVSMVAAINEILDAHIVRRFIKIKEIKEL